MTTAVLMPSPSPVAEDALIPLSALQHYLFCPWQCALIHVEQTWAEDSATAEGRILDLDGPLMFYQAAAGVRSRSAQGLRLRFARRRFLGFANL